MLSLQPRFDLFEFSIPRDWFPQELIEKYGTLLRKNLSVLMDPVDFVNESVVGVNLPGIDDLVITQEQTSTNDHSLGKMRYNREPAHENAYKTPDNPLRHIEKEFKIAMRQDQGLLNYFLMYESIFWHICKPQMFDKGEDVFKLRIANEQGVVYAVVDIMQPTVKGITGLEFTYNKHERAGETFDVTFAFNNINFEFAEFEQKPKIFDTSEQTNNPFKKI